ncbi:MAG: DUF2779 domain-containing protein, partial [Candidatus Dojkabacteria bacterium]|nr:DUF2779 domain-containing protein [Candidatus Dojkabacteria bacterium]
PDLSYTNLDIHKGDQASALWYNIIYGDGKDKEETVKNLLKYCELDTFAMYRIWEVLNKVII